MRNANEFTVHISVDGWDDIEVVGTVVRTYAGCPSDGVSPPDEPEFSIDQYSIKLEGEPWDLQLLARVPETMVRIIDTAEERLRERAEEGWDE